MTKAVGLRAARLGTGDWVEPIKPLSSRPWFAKRVERQFAKFSRSRCPRFEALTRTKSEAGATWRAEIANITIKYVAWAEFERTSVARRPAVKLLSKIGYFARALAETIDSPIDGSALSIARSGLHKHLNLRDWGTSSSIDDVGLTSEERAGLALLSPEETPLPPPLIPLDDFLAHVCDYSQAALAAASDISDEATTVDGDQWDRWIYIMIKFCERNGLPTSVSAKSEFVSFIESLQLSLVDELEWLFRLNMRRVRRSPNTRMSELEAQLNERLTHFGRHLKSPESLRRAIDRAEEAAAARIAQQNRE